MIRDVKAFSLLGLGLLLGLWGIRWSLPSRERLARVLPPLALEESFLTRLEDSWKEMYRKLGPEPLLKPEIWSVGFSADAEIRPGWNLPPDALLNSTRSFFLRSGNEDEAPILVALSRIRPHRLQLNPKIYYYGGLYFYLLGFWIAVMSVFTPLHLVPAISHYMAHLDQMAWLYIAARSFSVLQYLMGGLGLYWVGKRLFSAEAGLWAALFYLVSPGIVLQAHVVKCHLLGAFFIMGAYYCLARLLQGGPPTLWRWAGILIGSAVGTAPIFGLGLGLLPLAFAIKGWEEGRWPRRDFPWMLRACVWGAAVFFATNPYYVYAFNSSWKAVSIAGQAAARDFNFIWQFPIFGFPKAVTLPVEACVLFGVLAAINLKNTTRRWTLAVFAYYLLNVWSMQTADSLISARHFPAFFAGFLLAGARIAEWSSRRGLSLRHAARGVAAASVLYAFWTSAAIDHNLALDDGRRCTRTRAGAWIEANLPPGSELGFLKMFQPSCSPYFQWNRYRLRFIERRVFVKLPPERLPKYLVLISDVSDNRQGLGEVLNRDYKPLQTFPQASFLGRSLGIGEIYGNPRVDIFSRTL